jgi:hypothetical protein
MLKRMFVAFAVVVLSLVGSAGPSDAGVNVNINIGLPPPIAISAPPALIVVPGSYVYFAPEVEVDLVFFQGFWYRPHAGHWYRSDNYNGGWVVVNVVPAPIMNLPPRWKQTYSGRSRMPYREVHDNWQAWERDRHWEKEERKHRERSDDDRDRKGGKHKKEKRGKHRGDDDDDRRGGR